MLGRVAAFTRPVSMPDYYLFTDKNGVSSPLIFGLPFTEFVEIKAGGKPFTMEDSAKAGRTKHITFEQDYLIGAYPVRSSFMST